MKTILTFLFTLLTLFSTKTLMQHGDFTNAEVVLTCIFTSLSTLFICVLNIRSFDTIDRVERIETVIPSLDNQLFEIKTEIAYLKSGEKKPEVEKTNSWFDNYFNRPEIKDLLNMAKKQMSDVDAGDTINDEVQMKYLNEIEALKLENEKLSQAVDNLLDQKNKLGEDFLKLENRYSFYKVFLNNINKAVYNSKLSCLKKEKFLQVYINECLTSIKEPEF